MATLKDKTKAKPTAKIKTKKSSGDPNASVLDNAYADLLDAIDKALNLGGDMHRYRLSTGILTFDLCIGGGLVPGMTVVAGGEGSGKSTAAMHVIKAALDAKIPIIKYKDPEGSVDPDYTGKILGVTSLDEVFGKKLDGKWIKLPKARYSDDNAMSSAFDDMVHTVNRLPDKRYVADRKQWFYVIDSRDKKTDRVKQAFGKPDHKLSNGGKLWFPTDNPNPQAVFIIDSGPLLSPDNVEEGEQTNDSLALQAREYSKQFPRIMGKLRRKCVVIFMVNQLRTAPMVKYGCFTWHTRVLLADGSTEYIGKLVNKKSKQKVLSYNYKTKLFEAKPIIGWFNNGISSESEYIKLVYNRKTLGHTEDPYVIVTKGHRIFTPSGKKSAGDLMPGDNVTSIAAGNKLNSDQSKVIIGSLLGDGKIFRAHNALEIYWSHVKEQKYYLKWKLKLFNNYESYSKGDTYKLSNGKKTYQAMGSSGKLVTKLTSGVVGRAKRSQTALTSEFIDKIDLRSLAVWYMDDGNFNLKGEKGSYRSIIYCSRFNLKTKQMLADKVSSLVGIKVTAKPRGLFISRKDDVLKLHDTLAPYIHPDMIYKVGMANPKLCSTYKWSNKWATSSLENIKIVSVEPFTKKTGKYDIKVKDNHNYIVGNKQGILVHNSPLYEPCGTAFGFNTSVRMWISQRAAPAEWRHEAKVSSHSEEPSVEGNGADHYQYKHIKNKKNKSATPFLECWIRVWVRDRKGKGRGIDPVWDAFQFLTTTGLASRGKKNAITFIKQEGRLKPLSGKTLSWLEFKLLVLSETENNKLLRDNGLKLRKRFKLDGKFHIRKLCNKMLRDGEAATLMNDLINKTSSGEAAEVEDLEDDDF